MLQWCRAACPSVLATACRAARASRRLLSTTRAAMATSLYPAIEPYMHSTLQVSRLHTLYYEQCGNPRGFPVVFLHGGPGGGCGTDDRRFFDPRFYRIILFDQRGAGRSKPHAELEENTTWHLVDDIEKLRNHLAIDKWAVFGGSWGSCLALAYSESYPDRVHSLTLRGIFTLRRHELLWFYQEGASFIFPDVWESFLAPIPPAERGDLMEAYYRRLTGKNESDRLACAQAWSKWEVATSKLYVDPAYVARADDGRWALAFARIECHYFVNRGFFKTDAQLIENADRIRHIPTRIVQGRYDLVCPMRTAWDLHRAFPEAELTIVDDAGHSAKEVGTTALLVKAMDEIRNSIDPSLAGGRPAAVTHATSASASAAASAAATPVRRPMPAAGAPTRPGSSHATPDRLPYAGVKMSGMDYPASHFHHGAHSKGINRVSTNETDTLNQRDIPGVQHKKALAPPGGATHNVFG